MPKSKFCSPEKNKHTLHSFGTIFKGFIFLFLIICLTLPSPALSNENTDVIEHEAGFYYTVKKGDTLWDLSERFSDSAWLWPDLWKENKEIPNPHWIYPGNRIRLYHKGWVKKMEKPVEEKVVIPEPEPIYFLLKNIDMVGFIKKRAIPPTGVIFQVRGNKQLISENDVIYVRKEIGTDFLPGSRYTIYRTLKPIKDKNFGGYVGVQHYIVGIAEIINQETEFAVAKIIRSFRAIQIDDKLMPYTHRSTMIPVATSTSGISGNIIKDEENRNFFGDHNIAFIDKGAVDGIIPGQFYEIFHQPDVNLDRKTKKKISLTPYAYGELFVLRSEETTSTVIITKSKDHIKPGAKIRSMVE